MPTELKLVYIDIENSPNKGFFWDGMYEQNILSTIEYGTLISFSASIEGDPKVYAWSLNDFKRNKKYQLVKKLHEVMSMADVIVAHNGDKFDIKKANTYFIKYGFKPLPPKKTVDTLKIAKKYFKFNSNKLSELAKYLGIGVKTETGGFKLWEDCMKNKPSAWKLMVKYNKQDVVLLKKVYKKMLPWIENHPHLARLINVYGKCPNCLSERLMKRGFELIGKKLVQRYQCQGCGAWTNQNKIDR